MPDLGGNRMPLLESLQLRKSPSQSAAACVRLGLFLTDCIETTGVNAISGTISPNLPRTLQFMDL